MDQTLQFIPAPYTASVDTGSFTWSAPSNIALVKYWGKKPSQIPANPSISFTLKHCKTITKLGFKRKSSKGISFELLFDGHPKPEFNGKIESFLNKIGIYLPFVNDFHFTIDTRNTFPHSSGIASSASAMAAMAVNLMSVERLLNPEITDDHFYRKASFLARIGSGSACRSIRGSVVEWGQNSSFDGSSDLFGIRVGKIHPVFQNYQDTILLVDRGEKQVSSTAGHNLMDNHPFAAKRFAQAHENLAQMKHVLETGNVEAFVALAESEALTLHSMMMTSMPYFVLMKPNTLEIINRIWNFRQKSNIPVCFTLDAGANVHVLYPEINKSAVIEFIKAELLVYCQDKAYICDEIGEGAQLINK